MTASTDITEKENEAIQELRERLKGDMEQELHDDKFYFLRFLRAQELNINNAEAMIRKNLLWREENDVKNALKWKRKEVFMKYIANNLIGFTKDACVIRYVPTGNSDYIGILKSCTTEEAMKCLIYEMELDTFELKKQSETLGRNVDQCVYIYNFENFSFATATSKDALYFVIHLVEVFMNHYPERLKDCYILNVSMFFYLMFAALKPLLPKKILDKIHIYSNDAYKNDLLEIIDADVLPAFLGGNRTDPDGNPLCLNTISHAGEPVPESYFLHKGKRLLSKDPDVKKIVLPSAAFHEENFEVKETGSYIEWEFETKCRDIGFGLFYNTIVDGEEKITELIPIQRIDTEKCSETGTYRCDKSGKYVIVFDNTYSWLRQKEIYIRAKVLTPQEHKAQLNN